MLFDAHIYFHLAHWPRIGPSKRPNGPGVIESKETTSGIQLRARNGLVVTNKLLV